MRSGGKTFGQMWDNAPRDLGSPTPTREDPIAAGEVLRFIRPYTLEETG